MRVLRTMTTLPTVVNDSQLLGQVRTPARSAAHDLSAVDMDGLASDVRRIAARQEDERRGALLGLARAPQRLARPELGDLRSEEHTSELQSRENLVCRLLLEEYKDVRPHGTSDWLRGQHRD